MTTTAVEYGQTFALRVSLWDGQAMRTGKTVAVSISRRLDGFYWDGAAWQVGIVALTMTELLGDVSLEGQYKYEFDVPSGAERYDWNVKYSEGSFLTYFRGSLNAVYDLNASGNLIVAGGGGGGTSITLGPVVGTTLPGSRVSSPIALESFANEAKSFVLTALDADGDFVDLSGKTLRFVVIDSNMPPNPKFKVEDADIAISGASNEVATIPVLATNVPSATREWHWRLWDLAVPAVLLHGTFMVFPAKDDTV